MPRKRYSRDRPPVNINQKQLSSLVRLIQQRKKSNEQVTEKERQRGLKDNKKRTATARKKRSHKVYKIERDMQVERWFSEQLGGRK